MEWSDWVQSLSKTAVDAYAAKQQADAQYDIQKLQLQQGVSATATPATSIGGISPTMLLLGAAALVAVLVLKD